MIDVCKNGTDLSHPFGSSTVKPGTISRFKSFEEVIKFYNDSTGRVIDVNCNAYLIDKPLPYTYSAPLVVQPIFSKPDTCACQKIKTYHDQYVAQSASYKDFSEFLLKRYQTIMSQGSLDTLMGMCSNTFTCKFLPQPINLPPTFQCNVSNPCIECNDFNQAYNKFKALFPGVMPAFEEEDTIQQKKNALFANYMNQQFGFHKTTFDYLTFKAECDSAGITAGANTDSLKALISGFQKYYAAAVNGQVYRNLKITPAASAQILAANAIVKAKGGQALPYNYTIAPYNRDFSGKLGSVIAANGTYHAITAFPLAYTLPGDTRLGELWNNAIMPADFASGTASEEELTTKYYAMPISDRGMSFGQIWNSRTYNPFPGVSTPLLKYLPVDIGVSVNDVFEFAFFKIPTTVQTVDDFNGFYQNNVNVSGQGYSASVINTSSIKEIKNLKLATEFLNPASVNSYSPRALKVTIVQTNGLEVEAYMYCNYDNGYVKYLETIDTSLYSADCKIAFANYYNQKNGTAYTAVQIDSLYRANNIEPNYCPQNCTALSVAASGVAKPSSVTCTQLITTYKNFMADFPHPEKGATVKTPGNSFSSLNTLNMRSLGVEDESSADYSVPQQEFVIDSIAPMADSIQVSAQEVEPVSVEVSSLSMHSMSVSTLAAAPLLVDTFLQGKELLEWYFNTHLNLTGYTYEQFMDWLVNSCGYPLHQLPLSEDAVVCCDTLQTLLNSFNTMYPGTTATITETKTVPVHKVTHLMRNFTSSGTFLSESSFPSGASLAAETWTNSGQWFIIRDNVGFNFNVLPLQATINNASFNLYAKPEQIEFFPCCGAHYRTTTDNVFGTFEKIEGLVVPGQTLSSTQPATDTLHKLTIAPISIPNGSSSGSNIFSNENYLNQNCTDLVRDLYQNAADNHNYGVLFKLNKESLAYKAYNFWGITSYTPVAKLPNLQVNYTASRCDLFASYINNALGTHLSTGQVARLYNKCGIYQTPCGATMPPTPAVSNGPRLCGTEPADENTLFFEEDACADSTGMAIVRATERYRMYTDSLSGSFTEAYQQKCLNAINLERFTVEHPVSEYHYTLYYYDQAGNLVKTVAPEGVRPNRTQQWHDAVEQNREAGNRLAPNHVMVTTYRYNSLNQVVSQQSPDGGYSEFWYDKLGRLVVSRNAKQKKEGKWSYTLYDPLGRITEVGQKVQVAAMTNALARNPQALQTWLKTEYRNENNSRCIAEQVTTTTYDLADAVTAGLSKPISFTQKGYTLRNRVGYTRTYDYLFAGNLTGAPVYGVYNYSTLYSYDIHGNVDTLMQYYRSGLMAAQGNNRFKVMAYRYDLISGKVNEVHFQPGQPDQLYHRYSYDADNRLTDVYTTDNKILLYDVNGAEHDARYDYYKHGPLARTVLGTQRVQGLDYAYTLQGWLKGVNATGLNHSFDMGEDGKARGVAKDAFGFSLNYFTGDYAAISGRMPFPGHTGYINSDAYKPLYNGNISSMAVSIEKLNGTQLYNYIYDQLNRLVGMDAYRGFDSVNNNWNGLVYKPDYGEKTSYDANGNILSYLRNGDAARLSMDKMGYSYKPGTNQLDKVVDTVPDASSPEYGKYGDIKGGQMDGNYSYDAIGNLVKDKAEKITDIKWSVYGKILSIAKEAMSNGEVETILYTYDASGNRISKEVKKKNVAASDITWYVRDASGNVMSVYTYTGSSLSSGKLYLSEHHLYGSSRIGVWNRNVDMGSSISTTNIPLLGPTYGGSLERGMKIYELSNHLGNVLATVSDRKLGVDTDNNGSVDYYMADVVSALDYYPFGMKMPGRKYNAANYRYGFNGKEENDEVSGDGNQQDYGMRMYDVRVGKFLSMDPLMKKYPELTPYQFASNTTIQAVDLDGAEAFFIHGTASNPSRWTEKPGTITQYLRISGNKQYDAGFEWGRRVSNKQPDALKSGNGFFNQSSDRKTAALQLVNYIATSGLIDPKEGMITLIGHSHGGNVAIQASDELRKYLDSKDEYKNIKINIITVATPAENTPFVDENPREHMKSINYHLHLYNEEDVVQRTLSNAMKKPGAHLPFLRTYKNFNPLSRDVTTTQKIDVSKYYGNHIIATNLGAHSFDSEHPELLDQVQPIPKNK